MTLSSSINSGIAAKIGELKKLFYTVYLYSVEDAAAFPHRKEVPTQLNDTDHLVQEAERTPGCLASLKKPFPDNGRRIAVWSFLRRQRRQLSGGSRCGSSSPDFSAPLASGDLLRCDPQPRLRLRPLPAFDPPPFLLGEFDVRIVFIRIPP
jgi:hypothetical protein